MQHAGGGGGGGVADPTGWLMEPVPKNPVPTTFDAALNMASWLSLGHWALVALDKADGSFDLQQQVQEWLVGDWEHVAVAAAAMRNLKGYVESVERGVTVYADAADRVWDGRAAEEAADYFLDVAASLQDAANKLEIAAKGYDDVADGVYGVAKDVGTLVETLIDLLIAAGVSAAATVAGSWTLIGAAIGTAATFYGITRIVETIQLIITTIKGAMTFVDVFSDVVLGLLGSAGDWHEVTVPASFDNRVVGG